ncbi:TPA: SDR family NAD(P)-dependent oxidoreductase [Klebsiella variicola]|nr:SDR family NAD(P)-dependent oxidoreductase [Klebsiella variicola]HDK6429999.1 SDR family NAD(P)-dependent oxidoreductase [Klebsiella variicola]
MDTFTHHLTSISDATIINVSSSLAFVTYPDAPVHSMTKAAIHSYSLSLREQLRKQVEVIEINPQRSRLNSLLGNPRMSIL